MPRSVSISHSRPAASPAIRSFAAESNKGSARLFREVTPCIVPTSHSRPVAFPTRRSLDLSPRLVTISLSPREEPTKASAQLIPELSPRYSYRGTRPNNPGDLVDIVQAQVLQTSAVGQHTLCKHMFGGSLSCPVGPVRRSIRCPATAAAGRCGGMISSRSVARNTMRDHGRVTRIASCYPILKKLEHSDELVKSQSACSTRSHARSVSTRSGSDESSSAGCDSASTSFSASCQAGDTVRSGSDESSSAGCDSASTSFSASCQAGDTVSTAIPEGCLEDVKSVISVQAIQTTATASDGGAKSSSLNASRDMSSTGATKGRSMETCAPESTLPQCDLQVDRPPSQPAESMVEYASAQDEDVLDCSIAGASGSEYMKATLLTKLTKMLLESHDKCLKETDEISVCAAATPFSPETPRSFRMESSPPGFQLKSSSMESLILCDAYKEVPFELQGQTLTSEMPTLTRYVSRQLSHIEHVDQDEM